MMLIPIRIIDLGIPEAYMSSQTGASSGKLSPDVCPGLLMRNSYKVGHEVQPKRVFDPRETFAKLLDKFRSDFLLYFLICFTET